MIEEPYYPYSIAFCIAMNSLTTSSADWDYNYAIEELNWSFDSYI